MTNKPMLSVERELLEELQWHYKPYDDYYHKESGYYCPMCHEEKSKGHDATCEIKAAFDKPAAQHHGKPVAKLHAERLTGKDGEYGVTVEDSEWFNSCRQTGGIFNLYAEPPAPVALVIDIESAAKKLAQCMDYPWEYMPEQGRQSMREHAKAVVEASRLNGVKPS